MSWDRYEKIIPLKIRGTFSHHFFIFVSFTYMVQGAGTETKLVLLLCRMNVLVFECQCTEIFLFHLDLQYF